MKTLHKLFLDGLAEIYDAETRLVWFMPQMVTAATCPLLQDAVAAHLLETEEHVTKLEGIFDSLGERVRRKTNEATMAYLNESADIMSEYKGFPVLNAALIGTVQKIEHFAIATYGCLRDWAALLGQVEAARVLQGILDEDKATNQILTDLARDRSNREGLSEVVADRSTSPGDSGRPLSEQTVTAADPALAPEPAQGHSRSVDTDRRAVGVISRFRQLLDSREFTKAPDRTS